MSSEKAIIPKLIGSQNYAIWALRMKAHLTDRGYKAIILSDESNDDLNDRALAAIHLFLEDGPLLQIQNEERAHVAWKELKSLYSPSGFSADFLVLRELFKCKLKRFGSMEEFLNTIKRLRDDLKTKDLDFPPKYYYFWVLNNLTPEYEMLVLSISQGMRGKTDSYDLESLFSNLIDESKRLGSLDNSVDTALLASLRGKFGKNPKPKGINNYRIQKNKFCKKCKTNTHQTADCFILYPHKAPKNWRHPSRATYNAQKSSNHAQAIIPQDSKESQNDTNEVLLNQATTDLLDFDMDCDFNVNEVYITHHNNQTSAEYLLGIDDPPRDVPRNDLSTYSFILDTAATSHIICEKSYFANYKVCQKIVRWGSAKSMIIKAVGDVYIRFKESSQVYVFKDCLYMPEIGINIISQSKLKDDKVTIFDKDHVVIKTHDQIMATGKKRNNLYYLDIDAIIHPNQLLNINSSTNDDLSQTRPNVVDMKDIHSRMGHISHDYIKYLLQNTRGVTKITNNDKTDLKCCETCIRGKFTNQINKTSSERQFAYLEKVSSDICGPIRPVTYDNHKYFITFLDAHSRFLEIKLLRSKDLACDAFTQYANLYENNANNKRIRILATDNGAEYINKRMKTVLEKKGITHQLSPAYTKEPNGLIERVNRTIVNRIRCMLITSNLPRELWGEACLTAAYLYNRCPHSSLDFKTPFELKYGHKPDISRIRTFGSICFYKNKGPNVKKLDDKAIKGVLVGLNENLYKVYNPTLKKSIWVRDVHILENQFIPSSSEILHHPSLIEVGLSSYTRDVARTATVPQRESAIHSEQNDVSDDIDEISCAQPNDPNKDKFIRCAKTQLASSDCPQNINDSDDIDELALMLNINNEPNTFKQATQSEQSHEWYKAMQAEVDELESQNTWTLTPLPPGKIPLKGRWVYKLKTDLQGNITRYRARWVVKGFHQQPGIDYLDTFSTTCRPESYRIIFMLAMHQKWRLRQYDVKNAFIHAKIDHEIYVEQPSGFERSDNGHKTSPKTYCKLNKALYGLKQSPRLWYEHLRSVLETQGFIVMPHDSAIFIQPQKLIIIVCHVDDLITTGPDDDQIDHLMGQLSKTIKIETIGQINQFLGMEIIPDYHNRSIKINQTKYTIGMLTRFQKENVKPVSSPVELGVNMQPSTEQASHGETHRYQQQVGSLIYLAMNTRPDIAFAVNRCARYMSNPNESHFRALERIWKYLKQYPDLGLTYDCRAIEQYILGYTDADWGGDTINRKSTSGYIFHLHGNIVSWLSAQQKTVALSSCEAEYMAYKEACKESIYLNDVLTYYYKLLGYNIPREIPKLLSDSQSAIKLANNPEFHKRTKHIDISYHFIRNAIKNKKISLAYVNTKLQEADGLTKGLDTIKHKSFLHTLKLNK
ncbi:Retrovirus-related Pol polyprotein from transposon TNT 1-94 [Golovinomyces cichoracearum]|uniref:Retrovirus-related Pol polyprotein from transposon TNT 1-94 n=1 Tax=Golovinomyces cichoracearum TaxID=62708 RepID=A0A420HSV8_9PEZI|nr:Retrovirus-related Pol polyprotein from transposon TNT 1-94 [Golovinomyces cichoracearum]